MTVARICDVTFASPPLVKMDEYADVFASDPGADAVHRVIENSAIESKGMAVNALVEDPRPWTPAERMARSLHEAKVLGRETIPDALGRSGLAPEDVGLLATATTTTHSTPGLDALAAETGMRDDVDLLSLGPMGCYAALPAVAATRAWVELHRRPAVLLCVDLFSPHLQPPPYDTEGAVVLTLFGDAAAAMVMLPEEPGGLEIVDTAMLTDPAHADDLQVHLGDHGLQIRLAPTMPDVVASAVGRPVATLLERNGVRPGQIAWWALHPGGRRIIDRVAEELRLDDESVEASRSVMREYGNTAAPAVLGVLSRLRAARPLGPGEYGVALAFGPGATVWTTLLRGT